MQPYPHARFTKQGIRGYVDRSVHGVPRKRILRDENGFTRSVQFTIVVHVDPCEQLCAVRDRSAAFLQFDRDRILLPRAHVGHLIGVIGVAGHFIRCVGSASHRYRCDAPRMIERSARSIAIFRNAFFRRDIERVRPDRSGSAVHEHGDIPNAGSQILVDRYTFTGEIGGHLSGEDIGTTGGDRAQEGLERRAVLAMVDPHCSAIGQFKSLPHHHERRSVQKRGPGVVATECDRIAGLQLLHHRAGAFIVWRPVAALCLQYRCDR